MNVLSHCNWVKVVSSELVKHFTLTPVHRDVWITVKAEPLNSFLLVLFFRRINIGCNYVTLSYHVHEAKVILWQCPIPIVMRIPAAIFRQELAGETWWTGLRKWLSLGLVLIGVPKSHNLLLLFTFEFLSISRLLWLIRRWARIV